MKSLRDGGVVSPATSHIALPPNEYASDFQ
jgi:hypothetical protein